jgi:hypothetical protein
VTVGRAAPRRLWELRAEHVSDSEKDVVRPLHRVLHLLLGALVLVAHDAGRFSLVD